MIVCYSRICFYPLCQENLKALGSLCNLGCRSWITRNSTHFCVQLFHHARVVVRKSSYNTSILVEQITEFYILLRYFLIKPRHVFVQNKTKSNPLFWTVVVTKYKTFLTPNNWAILSLLTRSKSNMVDICTVSNWKIDGRHKIFWLFRSKSL